MLLKIRLGLVDYIHIRAIDAFRGTLVIKVWSLKLKNEFAFDVDGVKGTNPTLTLHKNGKIFAERITTNIVVRNKEIPDMSPQIFISLTCMVAIAHFFKTNEPGVTYIPAKKDSHAICPILIEALR